MNSWGYLDESTTHGVLCSSSSLVVSCWVVVEGHDTFSPVELNHHVGEQVCVIFWSREIVVGLYQGIGEGINTGEVIAHLLRRVVVNIAKGFDIGQPLDVVAVVG